jgi:hypothetical protein
LRPQPVSAYLCENVHYAFGGFNFIPAFLTLMLEMDTDPITFSNAESLLRI